MLKKILFCSLNTLLGSGFCLGIHAFADSMPIAIMPLSEVKPGMKGEWRTVISGTTIQSFPLEVIDVMPTFVGPRQPVIFCRGLDPTQAAIGNVSGMSGSPVFIDGKLVGAYAYGFPWPKDQTLVGLSPIEEMQKVLKYEEASSVLGTGITLPGSAGPIPLNSKAAMMPLPLTLCASGFSSEIINSFAAEWERFGLRLSATPASGGDSDASVVDNLQPGASVAAVLLGGDFKIAALGTVTWREGNTLLAFGHPFLCQGGVQMPMATAEVLTIVQGYENSFKLGKIGPSIGTIYQDRLTAVAGQVGLMAPTTQLNFNVKAIDGQVHTYRGDLFQNRDIGPIIAAMALKQALQSTLDCSFEQSYTIKTTIEVAGFDPIAKTQVAYGPQGPTVLSSDFLDTMRMLLANRFEFPQVKRVNCDIVLKQGIQRTQLVEVQVISGRPKPGEVLELELTLEDYLQPSRKTRVSLLLPKNRPVGIMHVCIGTAQMANISDIGEDAPLGFRCLGDVVDFLRKSRADNGIYVQLVQQSDGLHLRGQALSGLPGSVFALYESPRVWFKAGFLDTEILAEHVLPQSGYCVGGPCVFELKSDS